MKKGIVAIAAMMMFAAPSFAQDIKKEKQKVVSELKDVKEDVKTKAEKKAAKLEAKQKEAHKEANEAVIDMKQNVQEKAGLMKASDMKI